MTGCDEIRDLLVDFVNGEVSRSEREVTMRHLAECAECQARLDELTAFEERVRLHMKARVGSVTPPDSVWAGVAARTGVNGKMNEMVQTNNWRRYAMAAAALLAVVSVVLAAKPTYAGLEAIILRVFHVQSGENTSGGSFEFQPVVLAESALPNLATLSGVLQSGEAYVEIRYFSSDTFVIMWEMPAEAGYTPTGGEPVTVNGQPAVIADTGDGTVLLGKLELNAGRPLPQTLGAGLSAGRDAPDWMTYTSATRLEWVQDGIRVELLSNLSRDEVMTIVNGAKLSTETQEYIQP